MAKVSFTKLYDKEELGKIQAISWKEEIIEIKKYISLQEKMNVANEIVAEFNENTNYLNPFIINPTFELSVIMHYSNIAFTEKQKGENLIKTYDILKESGLVDAVISAIPTVEFQELKSMVFAYLNNIEQYRNSANAIINNFVAKSEAQEINLQNTLEDIKNNKEVINLAKTLVDQENLYPTAGAELENDNVIKMNNNRE